MNNFQWTYIGDFNQKHFVGLYHSVKSGNVMVYCNSNVLIIDFQVFNSKKYTFFIGEEMCEIHLERKKERFYYGMEINTQADTPRNRARKLIERGHLVDSLILMGIFLSIVAGMVYTLTF